MKESPFVNIGFYKKKRFWTKKRGRAFLLGGIFLVALLFYFLHAYQSMDKNSRVYANMGESRLPYLYTMIGGKKRNPLHAYFQELEGATVRNSVAVLPEDRKLSFYVDAKKNGITAAKYTIRSLDGTDLIEKDGTVDIRKEGEGLQLSLPIQNLVEEGKEYQLRLCLEMGETAVYYYTRILAGKEKMAEDMLSLGEDFTRKSFSKTEAKSLTTYLESDDTMDNQDLSHVNLHSSFQQITWGDTGMSLDEEPEISLKEVNGIMGMVQVRYASKATDSDGNTHRFFNEDNYVMRYDSQRIYLMDFDRRSTEIFDGQAFRFKDKKILLGVDQTEDIQLAYSDTKSFYAFSKGNALYRLGSERNLTRIFTYLTEENNHFRGDFLDHGIRIMDVKNNGDVDFLVYGYISRGSHEGYTGIVFYTYNSSENTVVENFFLPLSENKAELEESLNRLVYQAGSKMFYLYYRGNVYGIDTNSFEVLTLVSSVSMDEIASSDNGQYLSYGENERNTELKKSVLLRNLKTDRTENIAEENRLFKIIGFIERDLVLGVADSKESTEWDPQGEIPVSEIRIVAPNGEVKLSYKKENLYYANFSIEANQLRFDEYTHDENGYHYAGKDSVLSNKGKEEEQSIKPESKVSGTFGKQFSLPMLGKGEGKVTVLSPEKFSIEKAGSIELQENRDLKQEGFFAYSLGSYRGCFRNMEMAISSIYDNFGYILDGQQRMIWNRTDRPSVMVGKAREDEVTNFISEIPDVRSSLQTDQGQLLNLYGVSLNAALYYTAKGYPLMIRLDNRWELVTGYNGSQVTVYTLGGNGAPMIMKKEDAAARYDKVHNAFFAFLPS